jgi:acetolactate synthase-1/2/3 large subunit
MITMDHTVAPALPGADVATSESVAETFLALLKQKGVDYLFINSGTDAAPIAEAYARQALSGLEFPEPLIATHENLAVGMAHGHTMITGKPQAVMVHVSVGAANAVCAVMNARRDAVPMLFIAGRSPLFEKGPLGARSGAIHWAQEMYDQAGMLRELVKWDYELRSGINVEDLLDRALAITQAAPAGPVYLTLPREVLAEPTVPTPIESHAVVVPLAAGPDPAGITTLAAMIAAARCPVLVTSASGRDPSTVAQLEDFCERYGMGIVEAKSRYVCARADHPGHLGQDLHPYLDQIDLLICLESEVPWLPETREPDAVTRIVHVGVDPLFQDYPIRGFRSDLSITSSAAPFLAALSNAMPAIDPPNAAARRRQSIATLADQRRNRRDQRLAPLAKTPQMTKDWLNLCLNEALDERVIVVNEYWVDREIFDARAPGSFFMHSPAAGLGWGLPAAIGAANAAPDRTVVATLGDGSYLFCNPAACHQASAMHGAPLLTIICNNARWAAVQRSTIGVYPDGHAARGPKPAPLSDLRPVPDFEMYAQASGGYAERVTDPAALVGAIRRGLDVVRRERRQALLNVICG